MIHLLLNNERVHGQYADSLTAAAWWGVGGGWSSLAESGQLPGTPLSTVESAHPILDAQTAYNGSEIKLNNKFLQV